MCIYSRITSIKAPSFFIPNIVASLTSFTPLLSLSHDCRCYVSRRILASPTIWLHKHTGIRAHDFAHSHDSWHQPRLANVTCALSWRLCGITRSMVIFVDFTLTTACCHPHWHANLARDCRFRRGRSTEGTKRSPMDKTSPHFPQTLRLTLPLSSPILPSICS